MKYWFFVIFSFLSCCFCRCSEKVFVVICLICFIWMWCCSEVMVGVMNWNMMIELNVIR